MNMPDNKLIERIAKKIHEKGLNVDDCTINQYIRSFKKSGTPDAFLEDTVIRYFERFADKIGDKSFEDLYAERRAKRKQEEEEKKEKLRQKREEEEKKWKDELRRESILRRARLLRRDYNYFDDYYEGSFEFKYKDYDCDDYDCNKNEEDFEPEPFEGYGYSDYYPDGE